MRKFGLIGRSLSHSFSKDFFKEKFIKEGVSDASYELYELANISDLPALLDKHPDLKGLNVTVPYKVEVLPLLDSCSDTVAKVGAVNTISIVDGKLVGHNTDVSGFEKSLFSFISPYSNFSALILGTGGAAQAVKFVLEKNIIPYITVSRDSTNGDITYADIDSNMLKSHRLIINCTPLGTFPLTDQYPTLPYELLNEYNHLHDLVYNPTITTFMKKGMLMGAKTKNGSEMLVTQAEHAWTIWNS